MVVKCGVCAKEFKDRRGLQGHVTAIHNVAWKDYQEQFMGAEQKPPAEERSTEPKIDEDKLVERIAQRVIEELKPKVPPEELPPGVVSLPMEEVEVVGEKVNYKVALNPEIFHRYNTFKAEVTRRGKKWEGDFSDFLDLATKDILAVYGIYPTTVTLRGRKLLVELPFETEEKG
jgi:hypothetical protein